MRLLGFSILVVASLVAVHAFAAEVGRLEQDLLDAVKSNDRSGIETLLKKGAKVNEIDPEGFTPMHWACAGGRKDLVETLLKAGADINVRSALGASGLMFAVRHGHTEVVKLLLSKRADANVRTDNSWTALMLAALTGRTELVRLLLDAAADIDVTDINGLTPLMGACNRGRTKTARLLLDRGVDMNGRTSTGWTALMLAAYRGYPATVKLLLDRGADVNTRDDQGRTALMMACTTGYIGIARQILDKGADVNAGNREGETALAIALKRSRPKLVELLLEKGADVNTLSDKGRAALVAVKERGANKGLSRTGKPATRKTDALESLPTKSEEPAVAPVESAVKIAQLVGEYDRQRKRPTGNRTLSRFKLSATDLGVPFRHKGRTFLLFGDTGGIRGGDAIAYTTDKSPEDGIDLVFVHDQAGLYEPVKIPGISRGGFEVPMEGTSVNGKMYIYQTTDHSRKMVMGRSVVAVSDDDGRSFTYLYDLSTKRFINVSVVETDLSHWDGFPKSSGMGLVMFGSGTYRKSDVRLAFQPAKDIESRESIRYFAGLDKASRPIWSSKEDDAAPLFRQSCVGELSVSYNRFIKKWIMLYNCGKQRQSVNMRTADLPWGPWSEAQIIYEPDRDKGFCRFIHMDWRKRKCDILHDPGRENGSGDCYGPYQFDDLATGDRLSTTIYFTLSTWNPYTVVLMKARLVKTK